MFPNLTETEKKAIGLVFTCEIRGQKPMYYIDKLNDEANNSTTKWCNYFENHLEQVFILPEAYGKDGQLFTFNDKIPLLNFVKVNQLINPKPELSLSNEAKLYLKGGFSDHIYDLLQEAGKIFQKVDDLYKTLVYMNELDKWSKNLRAISEIQIKSPNILKNAIENNIACDKSNFKRSFERLEDLNALHSLRIKDQEIIEKIKIPIDIKINKLISKFDTHKKLVVEKQEAERKRQEAEHIKEEEQKKRLDAEQKMQGAQRKR